MLLLCAAKYEFARANFFGITTKAQSCLEKKMLGVLVSWWLFLSRAAAEENLRPTKGARPMARR
jgi:hypothetical protein